MAGGVGAVPGSLAEYQLADARLLARKPRTATMAEAAALPLAIITAWEGLVDRAGVGPGDRVLDPRRGWRGRECGRPARSRAGRGGLRDWRLGRVARCYRGGRRDAASTTGPPLSRRAWPGTRPARGSTSSSTPSGGPLLDASFGAVRHYTGHVVSILGWGTHSLAPLSFRGASYSGVFTLLPLLDRARTRASRRDPHPGRRARRGRALRPRLHPEAFGLSAVAQAHEALAARTAPGKVVVTVAARLGGHASRSAWATILHPGSWHRA